MGGRMCEGVGGPNPSGRAKGISLRDLRTLATVPGGGVVASGAGCPASGMGVSADPAFCSSNMGSGCSLGSVQPHSCWVNPPVPPPPSPAAPSPHSPRRAPGSAARLRAPLPARFAV